jgi:hypothetical protein
MTKEIPRHKLQAPENNILGLGVWSFSGAWNLEFGAYLVFGV